MDETPPLAHTSDPVPVPISAELRALIAALASHDGLTRERARQALVTLGASAVDALIVALRSPNHIIRQGAASALGAIANPRAMPALIAALDDEHFAVRWLAAVGLIALPEASLIPLLSALQYAPWGEGSLHTGAYHILRTQLSGPNGPILVPVVKALEGVEPGATVPLAAYQALSALRDIAPEDQSC
jgi:hypothetical protein